MITSMLMVFSGYLLEAMLLLMGFALFFRYMAYRSSKKDQLYFNDFAREIDKRIFVTDKGVKVQDPGDYINELLDHLKQQLPRRGVRTVRREKVESYEGREASSLDEFTAGNNSLIHGLQDEISVFRSQYPPNFSELTHRLMDQDRHWKNMLGFLPIEKISRMIDVLPGVFVVMGVFGTFVGISLALPEITQIDFQNFDASNEVISSFVLKVTFAMNTSIVGIVGSLILTFINTLSPIRDTRIHIVRKVRNSLEHLWHFLQEGNDESQLNVALPQMLEVLRKIEGNTQKENGAEAEVVSITENSDNEDEGTHPFRRSMGEAA